MKTSSTSGAAWRLFGLSIRLLLFLVGLFAAIIGGYLFLSGLIIIADHKLLPGMLNLLVGFVFISFGWRMISFRTLSRDA
jgi:hypothetical protein